MGLYAANGTINCTVVDGLTWTGITAPDGSMYVVAATGLVPCGSTHPCGARWVTVSPGTLCGLYAPDGSWYVTETSTEFSGALRITVVSGSLGASGPAGSGLLLEDGTFFLLAEDGSYLILE